MAKKFDYSPVGGVMDIADVQPPSNYKVILLNDDYTTKEFVVEILITVFHKNQDEANLIMEAVHKKGKGVVGVYPFDIALTRQQIVIKLARKEGFPLRCELEEN